MLKRRKKTRTTSQTVRRNQIQRVYVPMNTKTTKRRKKKGVVMKTSQIGANIASTLQPVFWRKNWKFFLFLLLMSALLALYIFVYYSGFFIIDELIVNRKDLTLDKQAIVDTIYDDIYGVNIFSLDTDKIKAKLAEDFPALGYSQIYKVYPRTVEIEVDNFDDLIVMKDPQGDTYTLNEVGMITSEGSVDYNLPVIEYFDDVYLKEWQAEHAEAVENTVETEGEIPAEDLAGVLAEREAQNTPAENTPAEGESSLSDTTYAELDNQEGVERHELGEDETIEEVDDGKMYHIGDFVMTNAQMEQVLKIEDQFERNMELVADSVQYYPIEREVHIIVTSAYGFEVWIDMQLDLGEQFAKLKAMQNYLNFATDPIDYIDLRIPGEKVFYKMLN